MFMRYCLYVSAAVCVLGVGIGAAAETDEPPDLARGPVDPYEVGRQRAAFLRLTGVDNELSAEEFAADEKGGRKFVQPFDRWPSLLQFDTNKNSAIDWLEANAYREDMRTRFLAKFDADGNRRLTGAERVKANEALAKGLIPSPNPAAAGKPAPVPAPTPGVKPTEKIAADDHRTDQERFVDGAMSLTDEDVDYSKFNERMLKAFDTDGNGKMEGAEGEEYGRVMKQRTLVYFDTNGDGEIDAVEEIAQMDRMMDNATNRSMKQMEKFMDTNRDGKLDDEEKKRMDQSLASMRESFDAVKKQRLRKYDKDADGVMSLPEAQAYKDSRTARGQRMQELFNKHFDLDGSGKMDNKEEFEAMNKRQMQFGQTLGLRLGQPSAEMLKKYDEDGDGKLVGEEQEEMMYHLYAEEFEKK